MTIQKLREKTGMSRPEFVEYFGIPYRSVQNWELGVRECPEYLRTNKKKRRHILRCNAFFWWAVRNSNP